MIVAYSIIHIHRIHIATCAKIVFLKHNFNWNLANENTISKSSVYGVCNRECVIRFFEIQINHKIHFTGYLHFQGYVISITTLIKIITVMLCWKGYPCSLNTNKFQMAFCSENYSFSYIDRMNYFQPTTLFSRAHHLQYSTILI